ncbi:MAG TPA: tetratricopeptide repeat protein [bacterium]
MSFVIAVALCALTFAVFWPATRYGFLNYDDDIVVWRNPTVSRGITADGLRWALTGFDGWNWNPIAKLSHMLDVRLFGLRAERHHLVNLLLHMANVVLVFAVLRSMTGAVWKSALVAALFAVHPQRVESVAWIAERKDVLSALFGLLAVRMYVHHCRRPGRWRLAGTGVFLALGLMSKPMLVTLPFVLLLLDWWPLGRALPLRPSFALFKEKAALFGMAAALGGVTLLAQSRGGAIAPLDVLPAGVRIANAAGAYTAYLGKFAWPANLAVFYPGDVSVAWRPAITAAVVLVLITAFVALGARRHPYLAVGWLACCGMLVPVSGLVQVGLQSMADRYTYLPHVGLLLAVVWLAGRFCAASPARTVAAVLLCVAVLGILGAQSVRQVRYWRDDELLFRHALAVTRANHVALSNLANILIERGELREGIELTRQSLLLRPQEAVAHNNMGIALAKLGRLDEARPWFETALRLDPAYLPAMRNLDLLRRRIGLRQQGPVRPAF